MLFNVTAERIARSRPAHCQYCAIAITVRDTLPEAYAILVWPNSSRTEYQISFTLGDDHCHFVLPVDAAALDAYDLEVAALEPFTFELPIPERTSNETCNSQ